MINCGKVIYPTKAAAIRVIQKISKRGRNRHCGKRIGRVEMHAYPCRACGGFHIGSYATPGR